MGAIFSREIIFCEDLPEALSRFSCEGRRVLAAILDTEAVAVDKAALTGRDIILIGNEGHGLSRAAVDSSDVSVILPINTGRGVESLNAATAASVFMALAENNINIKMIDQGSSELNIIVGVDNSEYEKAIKTIYNKLVK